MTHFMMGVLVPREIFKKGDEAVKGYIEERMAPYSENLEVEPYIRKTAKEVRKEFRDYKKKHPDEKDIKKWAEEWYGGELDSKGNLLSTWNKNSFWDWYRVGGRWDGMITDNPQKSDSGFNFSGRHETVENNSIPVEKLLEKARKEAEKIREYREAAKLMAESMGGFSDPFAFFDLFVGFFGDGDRGKVTKEQQKLYDDIVKRFKENLENYHFYNRYILGKVLDKDGKIHQGTEYGWFGFSKDTKSQEEWIKEYIELLENHKDCYLVALDCHI